MRGIACLPYILPMMDSLAYGRFLFQKVRQDESDS